MRVVLCGDGACSIWQDVSGSITVIGSNTCTSILGVVIGLLVVVGKVMI